MPDSGHPTANPKIVLAKVLLLEQQQGCQDRAVIGGLEGFVARWRSHAVDSLGPGLVDAVVGQLAGYGALPVATRADRLARALALAQAAVPGTGGMVARIATATPAPVAAAAPGPLRSDDDPALLDPVSRLKGVGPRMAEALGRLGLFTIHDLLFHLPSRYNDFRRLAPISQLRPGQEATVTGSVWDVRKKTTAGGRAILTVVLADKSGTVGCTFFNQRYLERSFPQGARIVVSGRPELFQGRLTFRAPEWEQWDEELVHTARLVPVYPLTQGLSQRWLRARIRAVVEDWLAGLGEPLPPDLLARHGLLALPDALHRLHRPADDADLLAGRRRLAFGELLLVGLWARQRRRARQAEPGFDLAAGVAERARFESALPFALTGAQQRCLAEISADLSTAAPMTRLLQGDVGSGKTAVAAGAIAQCVAAGYQAALMAPTEILAEQHLASLERVLAPLGYRRFRSEGPNGERAIARLVGSQKAKEKALTSAAIGRAEVAVVVGTHALIQEHVAFARLGLAVVDEQHRFGVLQRSELMARRRDDAAALPSPHLLVMTATPIPRTLALALNADLDQSVLDELPPGRQPVKTRWLAADRRPAAYEFVERRVAAGEQAYLVYPLVEESETLELRAAVAEHARLAAEVFPTRTLGLLHGRMRPAEKDAVMAGFRAGDIQILVATTVIEVGVDVPNASVMLIDGADRFGLAQLHQLRGRVGRGSAESVCLLVADDPSEAAARRLEAMTRTADGLALAELDLKLRGPGDYFGVRQSGASERFRFARLADEVAITAAQAAAAELMQSDPDLALPAHRRLGAQVAAFHAAAERV